MPRLTVVLSIFVGAFLLFQVQPLIAKVILPKFGGGAAVWTASLLFFQTILFGGYLYAHVLTRLSNPVVQWLIHSIVLILSVLMLPIGVDPDVLNTFENTPALAIFVTLLDAVGTPYFVLASTGPIVQRWLTFFAQEKLPYRLYSVSNVASLIALISFPFIVAPFLTTSIQQVWWSSLYGVYVLLMLFLLYHFWQKRDVMASQNDCATGSADTEHSDTHGQLPKRIVALWLSLSALGVVLLVATTSAMTQNVPPVPFLWILPLSLYLLTFIISFHSNKWYVRWYWVGFFTLGATLGVLMHFIGSQLDIISQVVIYASILFSGCMICHGELTRLKPDAKHLTLFYLMMSAGGFIGSAIVTFVAPILFDYFIEYPLALIFVLLLVAGCNLVRFGQTMRKQRWLSEAAFSVAILLSAVFIFINQQYIKNDVHSARNFYGALSVKEVEIDGKMERRLIDGTTSHGTQFVEPTEQHIPLSYYRANTGVALAFEVLAANNINAGFIGLGAGALAAYGRKQDTFTFYELNPAVKAAAETYFTYLSDSKANVDIRLGDGRVSLQNALDSQQEHDFNLLVVDAFSGDSIPQHLLTIEALSLYLAHLADDGIIAFHISNTHLDLRPLVLGLAQSENLLVAYFKTDGKHSGEHDTEWMWLTRDKNVLTHPKVKHLGLRMMANGSEVTWNDDFSPLISILK